MAYPNKKRTIAVLFDKHVHEHGDTKGGEHSTENRYDTGNNGRHAIQQVFDSSLSEIDRSPDGDDADETRYNLRVNDLIHEQPAFIKTLARIFCLAVEIGEAGHAEIVENQTEGLANEDGQRHGDSRILCCRHGKTDAAVCSIGDFAARGASRVHASDEYSLDGEATQHAGRDVAKYTAEYKSGYERTAEYVVASGYAERPRAVDAAQVAEHAGDKRLKE